MGEEGMSEGKQLVRADGAFGKAICDALGLQDCVVKSIRLTVASGEMVTVEVHQFLTWEQSLAMLEVLREYRLVPKDGLEDITSLQDDTTRMQRPPEC
jgi:hypothetical protein